MNDEWVSEWVGEWVSKCVSEWMITWVSHWVNERIGEWVNDCMNLIIQSVWLIKVLFPISVLYLLESFGDIALREYVSIFSQ